MLKILREGGTDYLFAGLLERNLARISPPLERVIGVEPIFSDDVYFCQDWPFPSVNKGTPQYLFYALPSQRKEHQKIFGDRAALITYAADPEIHKPVKTDKIYDVGFIGHAYYETRTNYINALKDKFNVLFMSDLPGEQIPYRMSQCKVLFNHTRPEIDVNLRFFEEMALGCQVMIRNEWLDEFAKDGVHYLGYSNMEECIAVIERLLKEESLREKISIAARSHFLANHTYAHRLQSIVNHLTEVYV